MPVRLSDATGAHVPDMLAIYAPIVRATAISFELEPPDEAELARRLEAYRAHLPWIVAEDGDAVVGYAYATPWRGRRAYRWAVETSVYVEAAARGQGVGRELYRALLAGLAWMGLRNAFGGITLPNDASVRLHESVGFRPAGVWRGVGYKLGRWHDVGLWQLALERPAGEREGEPVEPRAVSELVASMEWRGILGR